MTSAGVTTGSTPPLAPPAPPPPAPPPRRPPARGAPRSGGGERDPRDAPPPVPGVGRSPRVSGGGRYLPEQLEVRHLPPPRDVGDRPRGSGCRPQRRLHDVADVHVVACLGAIAEDR